MSSSVASVLKAIRTGKATSVDVVNKCLRYIERYLIIIKYSGKRNKQGLFFIIKEIS